MDVRQDARHIMEAALQSAMPGAAVREALEKIEFDKRGRVLLVAAGKAAYEKNCAACHQAEGQGLPPAFPALAGSKIVTGPLLSPDGKLLKDSHVDRVLNGKEGTAMQAFRNTLNDVELAAVITYERNALGNSKGDLIQPAQIKALR